MLVALEIIFEEDWGAGRGVSMQISCSDVRLGVSVSVKVGEAVL